MYKAILKFEHTWYNYDGKSNRTDIVVLNADDENSINKLVSKEIKNTVDISYGDFGLMTHRCVLLSSDIFETK